MSFLLNLEKWTTVTSQKTNPSDWVLRAQGSRQFKQKIILINPGSQARGVYVALVFGCIGPFPIALLATLKQRPTNKRYH